MALTTFERNQAAHARFMQGRRNFAESNPGALSPQERDRLLGATQVQRDAWSHEKEMLAQQGANDLGVAKEKARGMIGQGSEAAKATAAGNLGVAEAQGKWNVEAEKQRGANALSAAEKEWAGRKDVAGIEAKGKVDAAKAAGDAAKAIEDTKGVNDLMVQEEKNKGISDALEFERQKKTEAAAERTAQAEQRAFEAWSQDAMKNPDVWKKTKDMSAEERRAYWKKMMGRE